MSRATSRCAPMPILRTARDHQNRDLGCTHICSSCPDPDDLRQPPRPNPGPGAAASAGVVEDDPQDVALPRVHGTDTVPHLHPVVAPGAPPGPVADGEDHSLALGRARDHRAGLLAGALLDEHALAAREVLVRAVE